MTTLTNAILESVKLQKLAVLNGNPFQGWDGNVTVETVMGGLYDRARLCGEDPVIGIKRTSVNEVTLTIDGKEVSINRYPALKRVEVHYGFRLERYLQAEEVSFLGSFLMENFHH